MDADTDLPQPLKGDDFEALVQKYLREDKAKFEAKRLLASENYVGTQAVSWEDLENSHSSYIVQDLIPEDSIVFLVARRNLGKTFAYIDMVCSTVFGMPWLGKATKQVKIMIVLGEGRNGFVERVRAWCDFHGRNFDHLTKFVSVVDSANLNSTTSLAALKSMALEQQIELIIFDTWAATSGVQNEDDAAINSMTLNAAVEIRKGATLLFIHHPRKSNQDGTNPVMRGSGVLDGRADVVMTMYQDKGYIPVKARQQVWIALSTEIDHAGKNRTARTETIRGIFLKPSGKSAVTLHEGGISVSKRSSAVLKCLEGSMTVNEFMTAAKIENASTARRQLTAAVNEGLVVCIAGVGSKPAVYSLAPDPQPSTGAPDINWAAVQKKWSVKNPRRCERIKKKTAQ